MEEIKSNDTSIDLPTSWAIAKLNELALLTIGGDWGKDADYEDSDFTAALCIRGSEFRNWNENKGSTASFRKVKKSSLENRILIHGDILVEISGGGPEQPVGRTVLIDNTVLSFSKDIPKICTNFLRLLRTTDKIDSNFLNLYLSFFYQSGKIREYQGGSNNLRNLRFNDYLGLDIPIAPLPEQQRIVAKIEALFSELDKGIESFKTAREQLKIYRQALLKQAFTGKLTEKWRDENADLKKIWQEKRLRSLMSFLTSGSRGWAQYYSESGDIFIRAQNLKYDLLDLGDKALVSLPLQTEGLRSRVQIGDLLITITGANVTKSALVEHDIGVAYVSQHIALCRLTEEIIPKYLYWFMVAESHGRRQLNAAAYGAGKPGLSLESIKLVTVPVPTCLEQTAIVEIIEEKLSEVEQLDITLNTALQQAETLRQAILKKAFSGQLVPQDPNDEPASLLLERIQAEKTQTNSQATRQRGKN